VFAEETTNLRRVPIYEYRCPNGHRFEVFQRMSDPPVEVCVTCGTGPVEKLLFPVAVHFKGSGFYSTDYGRGGRKAASKEGADAAGSDKAGSDKGDKGTEKTSGETKPAAEAG
jgi:putative FmdB family regulatory protein